MNGAKIKFSLTSRTASVVFATGAVFIAWSLISVPIPGVNEPHYFTKARNFADPNWCREDFFLQSANAHAVFFALVGPVTNVLSFSATALLGRILCLWLLAVGWVHVGRRIGLSNLAVFFAACLYCLITASGNFSGEWVIGGFESKVPAYGFALLAVAYWMDGFRTLLKRAYLISGMMAGLSVSLHPVVGLWFCLAMAMCEVSLCRTPRCALAEAAIETAQPHRLTLREFLVNSFCFVATSMLFALPGLIPALQLVINSDVDQTTQDNANYIQIFWRLAHHLDPSTFPTYAWKHTAVLCVTAATLLFGERWLSGRKNDSATTNWRPLVYLVLAAALIAGVGIAIGWHSGEAKDLPDWKWRASLLRFYPFRMFDALLPMLTAFAVSATISRFVLNGKTKLAVVGMAVFAVCVVGMKTRPAAPNAYGSKSFAEWKVACLWLAENTAEDCLIWGPRESFGLKWYAGRSEYICFKDCPQDAAGIVEWNRRLWKIFHWSEASYSDQIFNISDLVALRKLTNVDYVLTRQLGPFESEPVYQNSVWRIYEVPK